MIERAVAGQLQDFLEETSALDPFQSGFRSGHGAEMALVALTDDLRCQLDLGDSALLILLDLSAAFDIVDHSPPPSRCGDSGLGREVAKVLSPRSGTESGAWGEHLRMAGPGLWGPPRGYTLPDVV